VACRGPHVQKSKSLLRLTVRNGQRWRVGLQMRWTHGYLEEALLSLNGSVDIGCFSLYVRTAINCRSMAVK
jgi:hypothetical protein